MSKARSPNRNKAFDIYREHNGNIKPKEIAEMLHESASNISSWKNKDKWSEKITIESSNKRGAPKGNLNSLKHGLYCNDNKRLPEEFLKKWFPTATVNAYESSYALGMSKVDKLGHEIDTLWAKVLRSHKITEVKNKRDMTKELKRTKESGGPTSSSEEKEYEIQFAWDKMLKSLDIEAKVLDKLTNAIKTYEELVHKNWEMASEEQKLRVDKLKFELKELNVGGNTDNKSVSKLDSILKQIKGRKKDE